MNNTQTDFYGKFEFKGKEYPFFYEDSIVTVVQQAYEYNKDFLETTEVETIKGITNSNKTIVFLDCEFLGGEYKQIYGNILFSTKGFILFDEYDCPFECIEFESEALNTFYPPIKSIKKDMLFKNRIYELKDLNEITENFETSVNNEKIKMQLLIYSIFNLQAENKNIGKKYSVWRMMFEEQKQSENIVKYYLYLLDFLVFANFRKNVTIEHFKLYKLENSEYIKVGIGKFFSNQSGFDAKAEKAIIFSDLTKDELSRLFKCIAEQRNKNYYNVSYVPETTSKYNSFNWIDWLNTALSFEGEYCKKYKNLKAQENPKFDSAKKEILNMINNKISNSGVSENNKKNSVWKKFKHLIEHTDTCLEEKYKFSLTHFSYETEVIKKQLLRKMSIDDDKTLSFEYANYRNHLAHGNIIDISDANIVNFFIMRVFIYCLILERADIPKTTRKKIVEKLFLM